MTSMVDMPESGSDATVYSTEDDRNSQMFNYNYSLIVILKINVSMEIFI